MVEIIWRLPLFSTGLVQILVLRGFFLHFWSVFSLC